MTPPTSHALHLLRELAPRVLGAVTRRHGDFADAEDAVQEALIAAAEQWPAAGIPSNPSGWLYQVAVRRLNDQMRSEMARRRREDRTAEEQARETPWTLPHDSEIGAEEDDALLVLFMCCHPSLTSSSAIALTLRAVGGLTTAEIASAFLAPESTMAQRISRAKGTIRSSGVPFAMPTDSERDERLDAVLHVIYLIFNEGYTASGGTTLHRTDLSSEAIRLARMLRTLCPHEPEVTGLLALMLLTDARRLARTGPHGELIPLDEQDRTLWDRALIDEGMTLVSDALSARRVGPYQLQAAIAAVHAGAARLEDTDWPQILTLYGVLMRMSDSPMVVLGHATAAAMVHGPARGLELVATLDDDPRMQGTHRLDAVRGHLHEMSGDRDRAVACFRAAAARTLSIPERDYLNMKAARLVRTIL